MLVLLQDSEKMEKSTLVPSTLCLASLLLPYSAKRLELKLTLA